MSYLGFSKSLIRGRTRGGGGRREIRAGERGDVLSFQPAPDPTRGSAWRRSGSDHPPLLPVKCSRGRDRRAARAAVDENGSVPGIRSGCRVDGLNSELNRYPDVAFICVSHSYSGCERAMPINWPVGATYRSAGQFLCRGVSLIGRRPRDSG